MSGISEKTEYLATELRTKKINHIIFLHATPNSSAQIKNTPRWLERGCPTASFAYCKRTPEPYCEDIEVNIEYQGRGTWISH